MTLNKWVNPPCKYLEKRTGYVNWCRKKKLHVTKEYCEESCEERWNEE